MKLQQKLSKFDRGLILIYAVMQDGNFNKVLKKSFFQNNRLRMHFKLHKQTGDAFERALNVIALHEVK